MCGKIKCGAGAPSGDAEGCDYVYDENTITRPDLGGPMVSRPPTSGPSPAGLPSKYLMEDVTLNMNEGGFECVCYYVPAIPRFKDKTPDDLQTTYKGPDCHDPYQFQDYSVGRNKTPGVDTPSKSNENPFCDVPDGQNYVIPYPRPPPSVELRGGQVYSGCQCVKRDGLQYDCPRTGCRDKAHCMAFPAPVCEPSGNAPVEPPRQPKPRKKWVRKGYQEPPPHRSKPYHPTSEDDPYVIKGRETYRDDPPVRTGPRVPCQEHRKSRC